MSDHKFREFHIIDKFNARNVSKNVYEKDRKFQFNDSLMAIVDKILHFCFDITLSRTVKFCNTKD